MDKNNGALELLNSYPDWEGAKILNCLLRAPNTDVYATVLELALENQVPLSEAQNLRYHLAPIRMTDEATLQAVDKRINQLILAEATSQSLDADTSSRSLDVEASSRRLKPIDEASTQEISALIAYRKECTLPTGRIKCFNDDDTKAYWRQRNAIRRLLQKAEKDGHTEAVAYLKAHLKMGKIFRWEK